MEGNTIAFLDVCFTSTFLYIVSFIFGPDNKCHTLVQGFPPSHPHWCLPDLMPYFILLYPLSSTVLFLLVLYIIISTSLLSTFFSACCFHILLPLGYPSFHIVRSNDIFRLWLIGPLFHI